MLSQNLSGKRLNDWKIFKTFRNKDTNVIRESKRACNEIILNKLKSNTISLRDWWITLKAVISPNTSTSIPPLQNNDAVSSDDLDKAHILNIFFRDQIVINETNAVLAQIDSNTVNLNVYLLHFSPVEIESVLKSLNPQVRMELTIIFFANSLRNLLSHSVHFFNQSIETGIFPQCWKVANVCPIYKNGDRSLPSNYRPFSLLCTPAKVMSLNI